MVSPYEQCPVFENENYLLRLVELSDAPDLLLVYSDAKAVPFFNSDNCNGDDFHYTSLERMEEAVRFWQWSYSNKWFVRWTVIDKQSCHAIGTIELFNRKAEDYFNDCGLLRLDIKNSYEDEDRIFHILSMIVPRAFGLFGCRMVATKVPDFAKEREKAVKKLGFKRSGEKLVGGEDHKIYTDYYVLDKENFL